MITVFFKPLPFSNYFFLLKIFVSVCWSVCFRSSLSRPCRRRHRRRRHRHRHRRRRPGRRSPG